MTEVVPVSPHVIAEWIPLAKPLAFFLATFVLEDVAAVGAGLLLATGDISWPAAFLACFLGIWMGDAGLYLIARYGGRAWFERSPSRRFAAKVVDSERWFGERGTPMLIFSRLLPGARLPTYLAAGFLRVPLPRFLLITGIASCVWTVVILFLVQAFGESLSQALAAYKHTGWLLLGAGIVLLVMLQLLRYWLERLDAQRVTARLGRLRHWEFWPAWAFYPPVALYCLWLAIKHRGLTVPTMANPGIFSGGIVGESKMATLEELHATSPEFTAEAELIPSAGVGTKRLSQRFVLPSFGQESSAGVFTEPLVFKPDVGQRGAGVKLIRTREQAEQYLQQTNAPVVVQRYAPGPREVGIFYYRFPDQSKGRLFSITEKIFPTVIGNGRSTIAELIRRDPRARLIADKYLRRFRDRQDTVLPTGEEFRLVETGNHAQGCIFRDGMRLFTRELEARIDEISRKLPGFFIGRYDIRYSSEEQLCAGTGFQIIELNGAASEATSIYDARNSIVQAYRMLFRQWALVFEIGAANRRRGSMPTRLGLLWHKWREYARQAATYPMAD